MPRSLDADTKALFVPIRGAEEIMGRSRSTIQRLFPHILRLEFPSGSRMLASPYLHALMPVLPEKHGLPTAAHAFAATEAAHLVITNVAQQWNTRLEVALGDDDTISAIAASAVLHIGRMTISDWARQGHLPAATTIGREVHLPRDSFLQLAQLQYPEGYPDGSRA